jgi:general stress protein YciG
MTATMKCPKCQTVTTGALAGKVGFSGPGGGPLVTPTSPVLYHFECRRPDCGRVWYPEASEIDSRRHEQKGRSGFASMNPDKQKAIASMGGKAVHVQGTGHEWTTAEAVTAGRKGGAASRTLRQQQGQPSTAPPDGLPDV